MDLILDKIFDLLLLGLGFLALEFIRWLYFDLDLEENK